MRYYLLQVCICSIFFLGAIIGGANCADSGNFELLRLGGHQVRWVATDEFGIRPITYALVSETVHFENARNCETLQPIDASITSAMPTQDEIRSELKAAFAMWSQVANIQFREIKWIPGIAEPNIYIGAQVVPQGYAFTDVHYGDQSGDGSLRAIDRSLICLNPKRRWKIGFDGDLKAYDLRYTFAHEIGHAIGLDHPSASGELMSFRYEEKFRQLQDGDRQGAVALYGPPVAQSAQAGLAVTP
jgi:matrixin